MSTKANDPTPRLSRAERGERSRDGIVEAALTLFAERGYFGVSLDDVAALSGSKRSLIIYYFKNKNELWRIASANAARIFDEAVSRNLLVATTGTAAQRRRAVIGGWLDAFVEQPSFARLLVLEGIAPGPRLDWLIQHFNYAPEPFGSPTFVENLNSTSLRDVLMAIYLAMSALGPLMEASLSRVTGKPQAGLYPISQERREELIDMILGVMDLYEDQDCIPSP